MADARLSDPVTFRMHQGFTRLRAGQTVGQAPGYKVSNLKSRCSAGGWLGRECVVGAKLCKQ